MQGPCWETHLLNRVCVHRSTDSIHVCVRMKETMGFYLCVYNSFYNSWSAQLGLCVTHVSVCMCLHVWGRAPDSKNVCIVYHIPGVCRET